MPTHNRRLAVLAVVVALAATAGCSAIFGGPTTDLLFVNQDGEDHDVSVTIERNGNEAYHTEAFVPSEANEELPTFEGSGEYTVVVTVDGNETELTHEFGSDDEALSIGVQNDGTVILG